MSKLIISATQVITQFELDRAAAPRQAVENRFSAALESLLRVAPWGHNIHIRVFVEVDKYPNDLGEKDALGQTRTAAERWPDGAPT